MKLLCSKCKGTKKFRGMGCVISICQECNGNGFIEAAEIINEDLKPIEKRKRVKRVKPDEKENDKTAEDNEGSEA